jgi:hypothetical protein
MYALETMTKDEKSLLVYFETQAVDYKGIIQDTRCMNKDDLTIAKQFNDNDFVTFKRVHINESNNKLTFGVQLSDDAWLIVGKLREARAKRNISDLIKVQK